MVADYRVGPAPILASAEAARLLLQGCQVGLFKNEDIPEDWEVLGEYEQPEADGYDLVDLVFNSPIIGPANVARWLAVPPSWEPDPEADQEYVYGWFAYSADLDLVVLVVKISQQPFITTGPFTFTVEMTTVWSLFD